MTASSRRSGAGTQRTLHRSDLPTPALVVDLDAFDANVRLAAELVAASPGHTLRPHVKAHRTPVLALRQLGTGTAGITCATVGEAEAMAEVGIGDILIANEIVAADKVERLVALAERVTMGIAVDSRRGVRLLSRAARARGVHVRVLIDIDLGMHRCGVRRPADALELARLVAASPSLRLGGIMGYEGRVRASDTHRRERLSDGFAVLAEARALLDRDGHVVRTVSSSGTSTFVEALADPASTEVQAGTYAVMEPDLDGLGLPFVPSVEVMATAISRQRNRIVLDAGRKSISCDLGLPVPNDAPATTLSTHEEHTTLEWHGRPPRLGTAVALRPLNTRLTFNLHRWAWLARGDDIIDRVPVAAAGRSA